MCSACGGRGYITLWSYPTAATTVRGDMLVPCRCQLHEWYSDYSESRLSHSPEPEATAAREVKA